jgi:hypothetical protein
MPEFCGEVPRETPPRPGGKMSDIVARLRKFHAEIVASDGAESGQMAMTREAADEIADLKSANALLRGLIENRDADIERLKAALREIEALDDREMLSGAGKAMRAVAIARRPLKGK